MKKYLISIKTLIVLCIFISVTNHFNYVYGAEIENQPVEKELYQLAAKTSLDIRDKSLVNKFNPSKNSGPSWAGDITGPMKNIINSLLVVVQMLGALLTIISIALFGLGLFMQGNTNLAKDLGVALGMEGPDARKRLLDFGRAMIIGSILLLAGTTIVRFVFDMFQSFQ